MKLRTAVGTKRAIAYANLFISSLEEWVLEGYDISLGFGIDL